MRYHLLNNIKSFSLHSFLILIVAICANPSLFAQEMRTWTNFSGMQVDGTFKEYKDGNVVVTDKEGKTGKFHISKFSEPDQKYIRDWGAYQKLKEKFDKEKPSKFDKKERKPPEPPKDPRAAAKLIPGNDPSAIPQPTPLPPAGVNPMPNPAVSDPTTESLMFFTKRTWKDVKGREIEGRLFSAKDDKIYLQATTAEKTEKVVAVPIKNLEKKDQDYVTIQLKGLGRTDLLTSLGLVEKKEEKPGNQVAAADPNAVNPAAGAAPMPGAPAGAPPGGMPAGVFPQPKIPPNSIPADASVNKLIHAVMGALKAGK